MAGDWIKMEAATPDKPEVLAITAWMGWDDPDLTVGKLFRVWRWFDQHTTDGNAENVTTALLDRIIGVTGFCAAMAKVGWLVIGDVGVSLPNFDKHNGMTAKNRVETARRVAKHRVSGGKAKAEDAGSPASIPRPLRQKIKDRDDNSCVYCGRKEGEYTPPETQRDALMCLDHVIPKSKGGTDDISNLVCACSTCNQYKSDRTPDECNLTWPTDKEGNRLGNAISVTEALPREEKRREEKEGVVRASPRGSRLPHEELPKDWREWALSERPDLDPDSVFARFADYWRAQPGAKGRKSDWFATWRNWVRDQRSTPRVVASNSEKPWAGAI